MRRHLHRDPVSAGQGGLAFAPARHFFGVAVALTIVPNAPIPSARPPPTQGANFTITATGNCQEDVNSATYDVQGTFAGIPVLSVKGNDACHPTDFPVGGALNLGHMYIEGASCPVKQGTTLNIVSQAFVGKLAPPGTLKASLEAYDQSKKDLLKIDFTITM